MEKISRNAKCPCGSGKKYKHCCINNNSFIYDSLAKQFDFIDEKSKFIREDTLQALKLDQTPIIEPEFWSGLGMTLSQNNDHKSAEFALKKAYKLSEKNPLFLLNIAANKEMQDNPKEALEILKKVPKGTQRKSIITGNIFRELKKYEEAIPYFEKAIKEEPDFLLAYSNLISCLYAVDSLSIEYWIKKSINLFPDEFDIQMEYCNYLYEKNQLDELYNFSNKIDINNLSFGGIDVISKSNKTTEINLLNLYIGVGKVHNFMDLNSVSNAVSLLNDNCSIAKYLVGASVRIGSIPNIEKSYTHVCSNCASSFDDINSLKAMAYQVSGQPLKALNHAKESLKISPKDPNSLHVAWWCLDDFGKYSEALEYAKLLHEVAPKDNHNSEHIDYNLALLYSKNGNLALAKHFYRESINHNHIYADENLAFVCLLDSDFDEAESVWKEYTKKCLSEDEFDENLVHFSFAYSVDGEVHISEDKKEITIDPSSNSSSEFKLNYYLTDNNITSFHSVTLSTVDKRDMETSVSLNSEVAKKIIINVDQAYIKQSMIYEEKKEKWKKLVDYAVKTKGSRSFALDLITKNNESEPHIGGQLEKLQKKKLTQDDLIAAVHGHDNISKHEVLHQLEMEKRGDLSETLSELQTKIPIWEHLPDEAKNALIEGHKRLSSQNSIDYAPVIVTIVKSLEISLKKLIFDKFSEACKLDIHINQYIEIGLQPKFKQAHNFIRFIEKGAYLELGAMNHVLKLARGKTANKLPLLNMFKEFILNALKWNNFITSDTIEKLEYLSSMRNPAAHAKTYNLSDAKDVRDTTLVVFSSLKEH